MKTKTKLKRISETTYIPMQVPDFSFVDYAYFSLIAIFILSPLIKFYVK